MMAVDARSSAHGLTYIKSGLSTDLMWVNEARLTSSRSTDSARAGGDDDDVSSVDVIGVVAY